MTWDHIDFAQNMRDVVKEGRTKTGLEQCIAEWADAIESADVPYIPDGYEQYLVLQGERVFQARPCGDAELDVMSLVSTVIVHDTYLEPEAKRRVADWLSARLAPSAESEESP